MAEPNTPSTPSTPNETPAPAAARRQGLNRSRWIAVGASVGAAAFLTGLIAGVNGADDANAVQQPISAANPAGVQQAPQLGDGRYESDDDDRYESDDDDRYESDDDDGYESDDDDRYESDDDEDARPFTPQQQAPSFTPQQPSSGSAQQAPSMRPQTRSGGS